MPTLTLIFGYLYDAMGAIVRTGTLTLRLQQDISSVDGTKIVPFSIVKSLAPSAVPAAPTIIQMGAPGATTYAYEVSAVDVGGETLVGPFGTTTTGNATLSTTNFNHLSWPAIPFAVSYNVYGRTVSTNTLLASVTTPFYNDKGAAPIGTARPTVDSSGGYINLPVIPTIGALPLGVGYFVEYDPDPTDTTQPARNKDGYWNNYWSVPSQASIPIGAFPSANRGVPILQLQLNGATDFGDIIRLGTATATNKRIIAGQAFASPEIRFNDAVSQWELSNGGAFAAIPTPATVGTIFSVIAGVGLTGGGNFGNVTLDIATQAKPAWLTLVDWSVLDLTSSSLLNLAVRSAGDLSSGTLPDARFPATLPALSGVNLTALNASNLASGLVPTGRLTGVITNAEVNAAAAIAYSKLALTGSIVSADLAAGAAVPYSKLTLTGSIVNADVNAAAAIAYSKLNLTGAILNADINATAAIAYTKLALTGTLVNTDVNAAAAIAWTKLDKTGSSLADLTTRSATDLTSGTLPDARFPATLPVSSGVNLTALNASNLASGLVPIAVLTGVITNTEVNATAGIVYSKLALSASILNADIAPTAAIAYSKLNLTGAVLAADIATAAGIPYSKLALTGAILNADVAAGAAVAYSKLNLTGAILNADINAAAAITYSKLALTGSITDTDVNATANIAWTKISKAGSSISDLATRSASDLSSGTVASALLFIAGTTAATRGGVYVDGTTITVAPDGQITAIGAAPSGAVFGDLSGTLPNPVVKALRGLLLDTALATNATTNGQMLRWNNTGTQWEVSTDGSALTALNASNITTGTVAIARLGAVLVAGLLADGALATPTLAPAAEPSTGLWFQRPGIVSHSSLGVETMRLDADLKLLNSLKWAATIGGAADVYLKRDGANRLKIWDTSAAGGLVLGAVWLTPGTAPTATEGNTYYDSTLHGLKVHNGTAFVPVGDIAQVALVDGATPALDASLGSIFRLAAAGNRTIGIPTNPRPGQKITIQHFASGGARTLALNTGAGGFRFGADITSLTATTSGKTDYIGAIYNSTDNFWDVVAVTKGF